MTTAESTQCRLVHLIESDAVFRVEPDDWANAVPIISPLGVRVLAVINDVGTVVPAALKSKQPS